MASSRASRFGPSAPPPDEPPAGAEPGPGTLPPLRRRKRDVKTSKSSSIVTMLCMLAGVVMALIFLFGATQGQDSAIGLVLAPLFLAALMPWLARVARKQPAFSLLPIMVLGLLLRFIGTYFRLDNAADAIYYHRYGLLIAPSFRALHFAPDVRGEVPGTGSVRYITGLVTAITGTNIMAAFLVFTTAGFIGIVFFYKAFVKALPNADHRRYALLIFLWPSMVYWPSSIGKEAIMTLGAGIASYGAARVFHREYTGIPLIIGGVWLTFMIRPHIGLTLVLAMGLAFVFARGKGKGDTSSMTAGKLFAAIVLIVVGGVLMGRTASFLGVDSLNASGVESALESTTDTTSQGGSEFSPMKADNPVRFPGAIVTVLFRPFPFEAHSIESFGTSVEGAFVVILIIASWRRLKQLPRALLNEPYVLYSLAGTLMFCFIFSYVANFGLLARQRTQIFPMLFVLLAFVPDPRKVPRAEQDEAAAQLTRRANRRAQLSIAPDPAAPIS